MNYYSVEYEFKTRPMFRKGRWASESLIFAAKDLAQLLGLAKHEGEKRYRRRKWALKECKQVA